MSSERLTVASLINSRIPAALGLCLPADRTRFLQWANEAEERMLAYGRWWGSIQEAQFCVRDCLLTWPREVGSIERISLPNCAGPLDIQNAWASYDRPVASCNNWLSGSLPFTPLLGWASGACVPPSMNLKARQACSFDTTHNATSVIRFYPTSSSDVGKTILVQGRDSNGIWVRTNPTGSQVIDGEQVTLAMPFADTITLWGSGQPLGIQKQLTNYRVLMYAHDLTTLQDTALGSYQAGETNPSYRVSTIPLLANRGGSASGCANPCGLTTIKALVKLAHVELLSDEDWLIFQNIAAYKEAMLAVRDWENGDLASGNIHFYGVAQPKQARASNQATLRQGGAIPMLRAELRSLSSDITDVSTHYENDERLACELATYR